MGWGGGGETESVCTAVAAATCTCSSRMDACGYRVHGLSDTFHGAPAGFKKPVSWTAGRVCEPFDLAVRR